MRPIFQFYESFYGSEFVRHFRAPTDEKTKNVRNPGNQATVRSPKDMHLQVYRRNGTLPCYTHVHNQKKPLMFDRTFFDFDVDSEDLSSTKKELQELRRHGLKHEEDLQHDLREKLQKLIINKRAAQTAIEEAKHFAMLFKEWFGVPPMMFFSGCKGAHIYPFFKPIEGVDINRCTTWFAEQMKKIYEYTTLDLSVCKDASSRISRVPYTKHEYSHLHVVPFTADDTEEDIMDKALYPRTEAFNAQNHVSQFGTYLQEIDTVLTNNEKVEKGGQTSRASSAAVKIENRINARNYKDVDHLKWFKSFLGDPAYQSPVKPYAMYHCPFSDHEDTNPSFMVYPSGYTCKGCQRKGNYWQFLKDYHGWTDEQVRKHVGRGFKSDKNERRTTTY